MEHAPTIQTVGFYCGRFDDGLLGEPLNSFTNLAFVVGALYAWYIWKKNGASDRWQPLLFVLAGGIGIGSFIFHSAPTPTALMIDLVPIQVFGLGYLAYVGVRYFRLSAIGVVIVVVLFFFARQYWISVMPRGALGGGITHVPAVVLLAAGGVVLWLKKIGLGRYLLAASVVYVSALTVRTFDLYLCPSFPIGVHWLWHLLTALTATILIYGIAVAPPDPARGAG
jgi:hypothetical protein